MTIKYKNKIKWNEPKARGRNIKTESNKNAVTLKTTAHMYIVHIFCENGHEYFLSYRTMTCMCTPIHNVDMSIEAAQSTKYIVAANLRVYYKIGMH